MKLDFFVLSLGSSIDTESNALSIFNIIEEIQIGIINPSQENEQKPFQLHILASFARDEGEAGVIDHSYTIIALNPQGVEIARLNGIPVHLELVHKRARVKIGATILVSQTGKYVFRLINGDGTTLAEYCFYLSYIIQPHN